MDALFSNLLHLPIIVFLGWLALRKRRVLMDGTEKHFDPLRIFKFVALIALLGLAGCAHGEKLATAKGPLFALNPDHWQPAAGDLQAPPATGK